MCVCVSQAFAGGDSAPALVPLIDQQITVTSGSEWNGRAHPLLLMSSVLSYKMPHTR